MLKLYTKLIASCLAISVVSTINWRIIFSPKS